MGDEQIVNPEVPEQGETKVESVPEPAGDTKPQDVPWETVQKSKFYVQLQQKYDQQHREYQDYKRKLDAAQSFGGYDTLLQTASQLQQNPRFQEFLKQEQLRQQGMNPDGMGDEQKAALQYVENLVNQRVQSALQQTVAPLQQKHQQEAIAGMMTKMDTDYGPEWRELTQPMAELAQALPPQFLNNPTFEIMESLYLQALKRTGKFEDLAAKTYEKRLKEQKAKSTPKPAQASSGRPEVKVKTMMDAYKLAKGQ